MAGYIERTLGKDERILVRANPSIKAHWLGFMLGFLFALTFLITFAFSPADAKGSSVVSLVLAAVFLLPIFLRRMTNEMALTNRRLVAKAGLISLRTVEINAHKIESVQVRQGIVGRILNYGTLVVTGTGSSNAPLFAIDDPVDFRRRFEDALEDEKTARVA